MKHRHIRTRTKPFSEDALNHSAKEYCAILAKRVRKNRIEDDRPNRSRYGFNIPKVVAACTSTIPPFMVCKGRNNKNLLNPHPTLRGAYPPVNVHDMPVSRTIADVNYYPVGHCAEPHAADTLLKNMEEKHHPIQIEEIRFSKAFKVKNHSIMPYCGTCRLTFPQLR